MKISMVTSHEPPQGRAQEPPIALLLAVDAEYRDRSARGRLPEVEFRDRKSTSLPVLQTSRRGWQIMAHRGRRHDDLIVHYRRGRKAPRQKATLYTGAVNEDPSARLIRGREEECAAHYQGGDRCRALPRLSESVRRGTLTLAFALALLPVGLVISENAITQDDRPGIEISAKQNESATASPVLAAKPATIEEPAVRQEPSAATKRPLEIEAQPAEILPIRTEPPANAKVANIAARAERADVDLPAAGALAATYQFEGLAPGGYNQTSNARLAPNAYAAPGRGKPGAVSLNAYYNENSRSNPGLKAGSRNRDSYVAVDMKSKMLGGGLTSTGRLAYSSFDPQTEAGLDDDTNRSIKLGIEGKYGRMKYGTAYQSTGGEFEARKKEKNKFKKGKENWESWTSLGVGDFSVRTSYAQRESNIDNNPNRPRYTEDEARVTLSHALSQWPYFGYSVSYGQGSRDTTKQNGRQASGPMSRTGASLTYSSNSWTSTLGTYRLGLRNDLAGGLDTDIEGYYLSGSYYPSANFSLTPSIDLSNEYYESDGSRTSRQSFSLSATRSFGTRQFDISAYGQYYTDRNDAWSFDTEGIYAETGFVWNLSQQQNMPTTLGLHLTYNAYTDNVYDSNSAEDVAAWLIFKLNRPNSLLDNAFKSRTF